MADNFRLLTEKEIKAMLGQDVADSGEWAKMILALASLQTVMSYDIDNPPANNDSAINDTVGYFLAVAGAVAGAIQAGITDLDFMIDLLDFLVTVDERIDNWNWRHYQDNPESESFDKAGWNKRIGYALNYGCPPGEEVVKENQDGSFDFRYMFKFHPYNNENIDLWLTRELRYLLNVNLGKVEG